MLVAGWVVLAGFLPNPAAYASSTAGPAKVLRAYSPGGPHHVLQECADLFRETHGVTVEIIKASPQEMNRMVHLDGDLYFGGAEYMLEDFARRNPGVLDLLSLEMLHPRRIGIVVRKGNPLGIKGVECLQRDDVDLLAVKLENMSEFHALPHGRKVDVDHMAYTGQDGVDAWRARPELDAWVTYESWHVWLEEESEFIEFPCNHALRFTPVALTKRTPHRETAKQFIGFLKTPEIRQKFQEHGWE